MLVTRAAASSTANGIPSKLRQISATMVALVTSTTKVGRAAIARSANRRRTASHAAIAGLGAIRRAAIAPAIPARPPLRDLLDWSRAPVRREPLATSVRQSPPRPRRARSCPTRSVSVCPPGSHTRSPAASDPAAAARPTPQQAPGSTTLHRWSRPTRPAARSSPEPGRSPPTWTTRRVLPTPPTPVNVADRDASSAAATSASSSFYAANKRRQPDWQISTNGVQRPQRQELVDQTGGDDLKYHRCRYATNHATGTHPNPPARHHH